MNKTAKLVFLSVLLIPFSSFAAKTINFTTGAWSKPSQREYIIKHIIGPFEKESGIKVNFQYVPGNLSLDRIRVQKMANKLSTDIVTIHSGEMPVWLDKGYIQPITDTVSKWSDRTFFPYFDSATKKDGQTYFVPVVCDVYLLIVNKKALKYLPKGYDLNDLTWEQYVKWSNAITKGDGVGRTVFCGVPFNSFIYEFGSIELAYGGTFPKINSQAAIEAWKVLLKLQPDFVPNILNVELTKIAIMRGIGWITLMNIAEAGSVYATDPTAYLIAPVPKGPKGRGTILGAFGFGIIKGSKKEKESLEFIKYMTRPDIVAKIAQGSGGFVPPEKEAAKYLGSTPSDIIIKKGLAVLETAVASGVPSADFYDWNGVKMVFDSTFKDMVIFSKKIDVPYLNKQEKNLKDLMRK